MKKIVQTITLVIFVFFGDSLSAQNKKEDVVYLKNGSIYRGIIIEQNPEQNIKIQTHFKNVIVINYAEIEKINKEAILPEPSKKDSKQFEIKKRGFASFSEIGYGIGLYNPSFQPFYETHLTGNYLGFKSVNGYQFNEYFVLGIGLEYNDYKEVQAFPVTIDARFCLINQKSSPVFIWNMGYTFGMKGEKCGFIINPQIGFKTNISNNVAYIINVGFRFQQTELIYNNHWGQYESNIKNSKSTYYQFITVSTGFSF